VLVVDDEEAVRRFVERVLRGAGYDTTTADDGTQALQLAESSGPFDIVVTDVMMPTMTGDELVRRLRQKDPSLKDRLQRSPVQGKDDALGRRGVPGQAVQHEWAARGGVALVLRDPGAAEGIAPRVTPPPEISTRFGTVPSSLPPRRLAAVEADFCSSFRRTAVAAASRSGHISPILQRSRDESSCR
jgi:hypothetical protein